MAWSNISSKVIVAPSRLHGCDAILGRDYLNTNASWKRETRGGTAYAMTCGPSTPHIHLHGGGMVLVRHGAIGDTRAMIQIPSLIDDRKCCETVRALRWPDGVGCPTCDSPQVTKQGRDDTQPDRQRYRCKVCGRRFDDLTETIFAGHHQPLRVWILGLYLMGLNLSNHQIAQELDLPKDDVHQMTCQ